MEENMELMVNEEVNDTQDEIEEEESGRGLGTLVTMAIGAALGVGIYKGVGFIRSKLQARKGKNLRIIRNDEIEDCEPVEDIETDFDDK